MPPEKVHLTGEKETMLITLYARAMQNRRRDPILPDRWAEEVIERIDYDFQKLRVGESRALLIASRARQLDLWTAEYLAGHPDATVLHLGCGLDSRVYRIDTPARTRWFDVDQPDVIELRRRLYSERDGYRMIGSSLADLDWLDEVSPDHPAFIVAEGVTMYLTEDIMRRLLNRLVDRFPSGQMAFDVHSRQLVRWMTRRGTSVGGTGALFGWGIDDPQEVERLEPRLELVANLRAPALVGYSRMPWTTRVFVRLTDSVPALRRMRCLLYRF
jgi:methyltransferase (TIGR00027 family)